ncbi:hypothetical protein [Streptomyces sanglieri]|uniref:hypothetical protein n=1 Tax=Streptomyces sanglieri TaxID=193460 RepID=UPI003525C6CF
MTFKTRAAVVGTTVLTAVTLTAGIASADTTAPYARAAAVVTVDGKLLHGKNTSVSRPKAGTYCVKVLDPEINLANAAIVATLTNDYGQILALGTPNANCGNAADTILVMTSSNNSAADKAFTVAVL